METKVCRFMNRFKLLSTLLISLAASGSIFAACSASIDLTKPDTIYLDNGDGTVTDNETGLMWQKCTVGLSDASCSTGTASAFTWSGALAEVQSQNGITALGYSDWRLPNIKELASLVERACDNPAINETLFPATQVVTGYWTSTIDQGSNNLAWYVNFTTGADGSAAKNTATPHIRLVRDAP